MIIKQKEIQKKLNHGLKEIKEALNLAKKSFIVGELRYEKELKPVRAKRAKLTTATVVASNKNTPIDEADLPDLDKDHPFYGKNRKSER